MNPLIRVRISVGPNFLIIINECIELKELRDKLINELNKLDKKIDSKNYSEKKEEKKKDNKEIKLIKIFIYKRYILQIWRS